MKQFDIVFEQLFKGVAQGKTVEDLAKIHKVSVEQIKNQLEKGIKVEMEHTKDSKLAKTIAMDHLFEIPDYYDKLKKVEQKDK